MKPTCLIISPCGTVSGYGSRSRDLIRSIISLDKYEVKLISTRWGNTPINALMSGKDDDIISRLVERVDSQPDLCIHVTVPNEFQPIGKFNIGVTAGIETTMCSAEWLEGCNRMQLILVPSKHSKDVFMNTKFDKINSQTKQKEGVLSLTTPIEVLFEGLDIDTFTKTNEISAKIVESLSEVNEKFCFLFTGHWLQGDFKQDRKNIGLLIRLFYETFKNKQNAPALILKTSGGTFSHTDRLNIINKINSIKSSVSAVRLPNVYLLHGDLTESEMNSLNNHPKVKAAISLTKGEGFGRPLMEFAVTGKPVIASAWSGHIDFLDKDLTFLVPGNLEQVHQSAVWQGVIIPESSWFSVDESYAMSIMNLVFEKYDDCLVKSRKMTKHVKDHFTLSAMTERVKEIVESKVPEFPKMQTIQLPKLKKFQLPKLDGTN